MSEWLTVSMLTSGGLFTGGMVSIAWERVPAWRATGLADFRISFAHTLGRMDRLQLALLVLCLVSTMGFAVGAEGAARTLAALAAAGFLIVLVGSAAWLVPIQRRLVMSGSGRRPAEVENLRTRWLRGHLIRTGLALALFVLAVSAAAS
jgi:hypothetical protein